MRKVVLVTGCSSGFGYLTAKLLAESGYRVYAGVRKKKDLEVFGSLTSDYRLSTIIMDVTWSQVKIDKVLEKIVRKEKRLDVLVNNAGFGYMGSVNSFSDREVRQQYETNVFGLFKATKAVLPYMERQKSGLVINLSSVAGLFATAYYGIYASSKFAVEALTSALRAEESLYNVNVVSVNPGTFVTKFHNNSRQPQAAGSGGDSPTGRLAKGIQQVLEKTASFSGNPDKVSRTIKQIIETPSPGKNYLVGPEAKLAYWLTRFIPQATIDWVTKKVVARLATR